MNKRRTVTRKMTANWPALLALLPCIAIAQVPVDEDGTVIGSYEPEATGNEDIPLLSSVDLEELVGPIALYPDDLLAIVLPASAYPLQIVEAARFLEALENDPSLEPDPEWDDSVVALLNYPEVIELLNEDIDWTWRLGEAVVAQQTDVVSAIEVFRDRAYAAGNLKSDSYQNVSRDDGIIEITPVDDDVIYVPYYEPERVVVYQPRPVYYYYPRAYPVYNYPYSYGHAFNHGYFWGVTTAFTIGWFTDSLNVYHHSYHGHPYYGHRYWNRWWYRRPTINVYHRNYARVRPNVTINRYYGGDRWRPRFNRRDYVSRTQETRTRHITRTPRREQTTTRHVSRRDARSNGVRNNGVRRNAPSERSEPIRFRERPRVTARESNQSATRNKRQATRRYEPGTANVRPTPKVRRAAPRQSEPARRARQASPPAQTRQRVARRSERAEPPRQQSTPRVRQSQPRQSSREAPTRTREATPRTRQSSAGRSEPRRSEAPRRERRQERPSSSRKTEPKRSQERKSGGRSQRNQERRQRR